MIIPKAQLGKKKKVCKLWLWGCRKPTKTCIHYICLHFLVVWSSKIVPSSEWHGCQNDDFSFFPQYKYIIIFASWQIPDVWALEIFPPHFICSYRPKNTHVQDTALWESNISNNSHSDTESIHGSISSTENVDQKSYMQFSCSIQGLQ